MARVEGFEPPTAWFVARYSIQLSYGRMVCLSLLLWPKAKSSGGERGIRTLEGLLTLTPLAGERFRPLSHLSGTAIISTAPSDGDCILLTGFDEVKPEC